MSPKWIALTRTEGALEAEILRGLLEANDIPVVLSQEGAASAIGLGIGPLAEVEIFVPQEQHAAAQELLNAYRRGDLSPEEDAPQG
ncbi:MAG: DUF2007 domain-containing protein [Anaerolineae bacterium]|nr:MAG: DUF2007 domain-containing protein [Anaerolineae bacterium]